MGAPLAVVVLTLDEELNLPACLRSVAFADEVFVVDSFSHDRTLDIARAAGAHVVQHPFAHYADQRNWALDRLPFHHPWVLFLDADERVMPELRPEIEDIVSAAPADRPRGYYVNRRFIFLRRWIRHAGWYPSWNLRLFQRAFGRYETRAVHEHVVLDGPAAYLQHDLLHDDRRPFEAFIARHNRYSTLEARARFAAEHGLGSEQRLAGRWFGSPIERKRWLRERIWPHVPAQPLALFVYMYLVRQGFRDGAPGLIFCLLQAYQELAVGLKLAELRAGLSSGAGPALSSAPSLNHS
jgi:glycosyltransferase involved in cell wall biosynthesis